MGCECQTRRPRPARKTKHIRSGGKTERLAPLIAGYGGGRQGPRAGLVHPRRFVPVTYGKLLRIPIQGPLQSSQMPRLALCPGGPGRGLNPAGAGSGLSP